MRKEAKRKSVEKTELLLKTARDRDRALIAASIIKNYGNKADAKRLLKDVAILWGDQWAKAIATARNEEERKIILQMMLEEKDI